MGKKRERRERKAAALAGITTYDADGDRRCRHCSRGGGDGRGHDDDDGG